MSFYKGTIMFLKNQIIFASITVLSIFSSQINANAGPAQATTAVNIRTGPGIEFKVLDRLDRSEHVDATECYKNSWCYVRHEGANGWVSAKYLTAIRPANANQGQNCKFIFKLDNNGPTFKMECEEPENFDDIGESDTENDVPVFNQQVNGAAPTACLYTGINFTGAEICQGVSRHNSLRGMNDIFASVKLFNGAAVKLCSNENLGGDCKTYALDRARLHNVVYKRASSMQVFSQFQSTSNKSRLPNENRVITNRMVGQVALSQSQRLDLDTAKIGRSGADLQYALASNGRLYLRALNGAAMAVGRRNDRGFEGCSVARFNTQQIRRNQLPIGAYICVKTNEGRFAQIHVNQYADGQITLGFETYN